AQLGEDLVDVRAAHEAVVVEQCDRVAVGDGAEVRVRHGALQLAQLAFGVGEDARVLHGQEPVVHPFGERLVGDRVVHEPPGDVDLAHGAAGPGDHFGREHG